MLTLGVTWPPIVVGLLVVLFVVVSCLLMIIVLLQRPQGGGLSEAFGASAAGAGNTAFGARVGDALTTATIAIFIAFLMTAVVLNWAVQPPTGTLADQGTASSTDIPTPPDAAPADDPVDAGSGDQAQTVPMGPEAPGLPTGDPNFEIKTSAGIELVPVEAPLGFDKAPTSGEDRYLIPNIEPGKPADRKDESDSSSSDEDETGSPN